MADEDDDVTEYVRALEERDGEERDPQASGDAIAGEFEKYLRRRQPPGPSGA